ncbi:PD-(D/E)XK nuclease-like domain-containing protein [Pseudarthrobacter sp. PS3-L1]|uniref:PD-(D/E)XK nuclease-like domain-containing protein n=1 Tax=Pseudarthrobacter sp. PS3-L1 TaxID=3046207 RepID=UPI0024BB9823|nr:PD-(D/E)XK nuclease-like domain-containing protein [Pseudarthrobacter sp. PS3-L1]MDJ0321684.1 PD-(D/E)XK nuclease-like domain-containing protein [Pseudarthrobacter sp. PS3-L1]
MKPGIYDGLKNSEYHADHTALSSSGSKLILDKSPLHFKARQSIKETNEAFEVGTLTHSLVLENDESQAVVLDFDSWRTKAAKEAAAEARSSGLIPVLPALWDEIRAMRDAVWANADAALLLSGGKAEQSIFWKHESGSTLKCRPDYYVPNSPIGPICVDLKSSVSADPWEFDKSASDFGYFGQQAWYEDGIEAAAGSRPTFVFIVVEKGGVPAVSLPELDPEDVELARERNQLAIKLWNKCRENNEWPSYQPAPKARMKPWTRIKIERELERA